MGPHDDLGSSDPALSRHDIELESLEPAPAPAGPAPLLVPRLRLDTSNLEPAPPEDGEDEAEEPPQSAILGLAKGENLKIDNWLHQQAHDEQARLSPVSPSRSIASPHRPRRSRDSASSIQLSPRRGVLSRPAATPSPELRVASPVDTLHPLDWRSSESPPRSRNNSIPKISLTVERSFQNRGQETPLKAARSSEGDSYFAVASKPRSGDAPTSQFGYHHVEGSSSTLPSREASTAGESPLIRHRRGPSAKTHVNQNNVDSYNLSLSGAAFLTQQDIIDTELYPQGPADLDSAEDSSVADGDEPLVGIASPQDGSTMLAAPVGRSLFFFTPESVLRRVLHRLLLAKVVAYLECLLTIIQVVGLCVEVRNPFKTTSEGLPEVLDNNFAYLFMPLYGVYTALFVGRAVAFGVVTNQVLSWKECKKCLAWALRSLLGVVTFGAVKAPTIRKWARDPVNHRHCVLRSSWGRVDFLSLLFYWCFAGLSRHTSIYSLELIIAGLGHLRILRMLDYILYTRFVLRILKRAIPLLQNVLIFIAFFLFIWGIVGVLSFNGSLRRVCVYQDLITSQNCGSWLEPETLKVMPYLLLDSARGTYQNQPNIKGYTCPVGSKCVELRAFPPYGSFAKLANVSFDNIFNSLEIVFIMMSANGFTEIMYNVIDSENLASSLFFISGVLVLGIWLMNLLVAVMVSSYGAIKENFMSAEASDPLVSVAKKGIRRLFGRNALNDAEVQTTLEEKRNHGKWIMDKTTWGKRYSVLSPFLAILTLVDLCVQAAKTPPNQSLYYWEVVLAVVFALDVLIRFLVYLPYWRYFFFSFTNIFDIVLAVANCIILGFHNNVELYDWLTVFQLLRIHKMVAALRYSRIFWIQVFGNLKALISLTAFFFLTTLLCTLIATKMLRGQFPINSDGGLNVSSFYDLAASYISMYQIASTENWTDILFWVTENVSRPGDNVIGLACMGILLCGWLFFANFLIFNLFLGIMSESLHGAIANKREEQVRQFAEEIREKSLNPTGPRFGNLLNSLSSQGESDDDAERPVSMKEKLLAIPMRWIYQNPEAPVVFRPMRAHMERKLVIEFLESHGELEMFTGGKIMSGKTFLNLQTEPHASGFGHWKKFPVYGMLKTVAFTVYGWLHNYPNDYRVFLYEWFEKRAQNQSESSKTAYVEEIFDYTTHHLAAVDEYCATHPNFDKSLMIFDVTSKTRQFFQKLFNSSSGARRSKVYPKNAVGFYVRLFFIIATVAIVVQTCVNTPLEMLKESNTTHWTYSRLIDLVYGIIFTVEFLGKVIADGFHYTPNAYTRSMWNCLDLVVLISIWMTFINDLFSGSLSRYLRALLALRALRLISFFKKSEMMLKSIFTYGLRNIMGACLIALSIVVPYAVWGKNIFHGRLDSCNDDNINSLSDCAGEYVATVFDNFEMLAPRVIQGNYFSYDRFWEALLIQFGVLSLEGWIDVLQAVTSITGPNQQPQTYASKGNAAFPIVYNYIGAVLIMSMLVAVIIRNYSLTMGTAFLTEEQLSWIDVKRTLRMVSPTPKPPTYEYGSVRFRLLQIIPTWITSIEVWTLLLVTAEMTAYFYPLQSSVEKAYYLISLACSVLLLSLSVLKLIVLKPTLFFHNLWNPFGLIVCLLVVILTILNLVLNEDQLSGVLGVSRAAYICLLLLWIPRIKRLYQFYSIGTAAISEIGMLLFAWFILYITYAIALNQSFGVTKLGAESTWSRNFRTIPKALIALFTMSCGEGWNEFLMDFTISKPYCIEDSKRSECGISGFAYFLFITWNMLSMYVFANLFISLVCEACWYVYRSGPVNIRELDIVSLLDSWQHFDPKGTGFIRVKDIYGFLRKSQGYFSMSIFSQDTRYNVHRILESTQNSVRAAADPYYVDMDAVHAYLADMPIQKYRDKRSLFELFIAHAQSQADRIPGGKGIRFSKLVLMFPLYQDMNPEVTLSLKEFLLLKVQLHEARVTLAAEFIARTWRARCKALKPVSDETPGIGYDHSYNGPKAEEPSVYWVT